MNKSTLALTSLIAAIPAGLLFAVALMSVLGGFDKFPMVLMIAMIMLLVVTGAMMLFPVYILIYHGGGGKTATKDTLGDAETEAVPSATDDEDVSGEFETSEADFSASEIEVDDDSEFGDSAEYGESDEFEFDDEDDDLK